MPHQVTLQLYKVSINGVAISKNTNMSHIVVCFFVFFVLLTIFLL